MAFEYHLLQPPFPDDFLAWYPYDKPEGYECPKDLLWMQGMQKVTGNALPGLNHTFVVAKPAGCDEYAGVCWLCEPDSTPELAHFGWFLTVPAYRGQGAGRRVLDTALDYLDSRGVEMVMLPTRTTTEHARGMYARRGFQDFLVEAGSTGCWMVRPAEGHYESYFTPPGSVEVRPFTTGDYVAFDYLINRVLVPSRLYTLGLIGTKRIVSFKPNWGHNVHMLSAAVDGRLMGVAALTDGDEATHFDFYAHDPRVAQPLIAQIIEQSTGPLRCHIATDDSWKREAVQAAGLSLAGTDRAEAPGGAAIDFEVFAA